MFGPAPALPAAATASGAGAQASGARPGGPGPLVAIAPGSAAADANTQALGSGPPTVRTEHASVGGGQDRSAQGEYDSQDPANADFNSLLSQLNAGGECNGAGFMTFLKQQAIMMQQVHETNQQLRIQLQQRPQHMAPPVQPQPSREAVLAEKLEQELRLKLLRQQSELPKQVTEQIKSAVGVHSDCVAARDKARARLTKLSDKRTACSQQRSGNQGVKRIGDLKGLAIPGQNMAIKLPRVHCNDKQLEAQLNAKIEGHEIGMVDMIYASAQQAMASDVRASEDQLSQLEPQLRGKIVTLLNKTDSENAKVMIEHAMIQYRAGCKQKETVRLVNATDKELRSGTKEQQVQVQSERVELAKLTGFVKDAEIMSEIATLAAERTAMSDDAVENSARITEIERRQKELYKLHDGRSLNGRRGNGKKSSQGSGTKTSSSGRKKTPQKPTQPQQQHATGAQPHKKKPAAPKQQQQQQQGQKHGAKKAAKTKPQTQQTSKSKGKGKGKGRGKGKAKGGRGKSKGGKGK